MNETHEMPHAHLTIEPNLLSSETLSQLAREFILREVGQENFTTDIDAEIPKVVARIQRGEFLITFDAQNESVGVKPREENR